MPFSFLASWPAGGAAAAALFGVVVVLVVILGLHALARGARRRARVGERARARHFRMRVRALLAGRGSARACRRAAAAIDAEAFWSVLDLAAARLDPRARRALAEALDRTPHVAKERRALGDELPLRREQAARRLGVVPSPRTRRALRRAMERGPERVTFAAARSLAEARDGGALEWLLAHPGAIRRRRGSARAGMLVGFGKSGAPKLLEKLHAGGDDPEAERAMVDALGALRYTPAAPAVAARLAHADEEVRVAAARALGSLGAPAAVPVLLDALDDPAWAVRAQAARALGDLGDIAAIPMLSSRLEDAAYWVRRHAAYALATLGPAGQSALARYAISSPDAYAREIAGEALAMRGDDPAAPRLRAV